MLGCCFAHLPEVQKFVRFFVLHDRVKQTQISGARKGAEIHG